MALLSAYEKKSLNKAVIRDCLVQENMAQLMARPSTVTISSLITIRETVHCKRRVSAGYQLSDK